MGKSGRRGGWVRSCRATFAAVASLPTSVTAQTFFARGKLMLTGEYLVLDGARALAVPTVLGQRLSVERTDEVDVLLWRSYDARGEAWVDCAFSRRGLKKPPPASDTRAEARLARLLGGLIADHPLLWPGGTGLQMSCHLEFARDWGLGSSSTLSYLLAAWAGADAQAVNRAEFGGSGYDVACAAAEGPLVYRLDGADRTPSSRHVAFAPAWLAGASLVHLGRKQDSRQGIHDYRERAGAELARFVAVADELTDAIAGCTDRGAAIELLRRHEAMIGYVTHRTPLGRGRFADFPGIVKSLGAWGGDFALALATDAGYDVRGYFASHGLHTVMRAGELLLLDGRPAPEATVDASLWPVFFYGELAMPDAEREWLGAYPHFAADLLDYGIRGLSPSQAPRSAPGQRTPGMLVYLPPADVVALDLHPSGAGYRRRHAFVERGGRRIRAQIWLNAAA